jgi:beta-glucosidase
MAVLGLGLLIAVCDPLAAQTTLWPAIRAGVVSTPADEQRIAMLLAQMTLEEKVGQMLQADIASVTPADVQTYRLGAVLAGGNAAPHGDVRTTPQAWLDLVEALHHAALTGQSGAHPPIPVLFGIDAVHGDAKLIGATIFPHNVALGAAHDPQLIEAIGAATAEEVASTGIDWTFAPTVAVARDVRWGRSYESYGESPELVARYAAAMVDGLQGHVGAADFLGPAHTLSSVKHFIGDGATLEGRDQADSEVPETTLSAVHGAGYAGAIPAGALIVMASYNSWHGIKANASHYLLSDVLKGRLGFSGFVVGDWDAHEQIPGCTKFSCPAAILAGVDMLMAPESWKPLYFNTIAQVRSGVIPQSRIDDAVTRILRVKLLAGCFDRSAAAARPALTALGSAPHRALAREAVRRSLVLLKNNHTTLPLRASQHLLIIGPAADQIGAQSGGWSVDWQGDHNTNADFPGATSLYAGIAAAVARAGGTVEWSADGSYTHKPDAAVLIYGESPYAEYEGDRETLLLPQSDGHLVALRRLRAAHVPTVSVLLSGRPLWVNPELNLSDAFVAAWLPGSEGEGLADVLLRAPDGSVPYDFSGRLSFSWPATAQPVLFDDQGTARGALFPVGYGLDYAHHREVAAVSEESQLTPAQRVSDTLFHAAHVTAPWSVFLADDLASVRLTLPQQTSPAGFLLVQQSPEGLTAQWSAGYRATLDVFGRAADLRQPAAEGLSLVLRYQVLQAPSDVVRLGVLCSSPYLRHPPEPDATTAAADRRAVRCGTASGALVDITTALERASAPGWHKLVLPLRCLSQQGADLSNVDTPLALTTAGALTLAINDLRLERTAVQDCGGGGDH